MEPLGVWFAHLRGLPVPSVVNTFVLLLPNYVCAVVATLPSHVLQRVGRRLRQAQELGSYHLVELLGRGGMGEVWRAEHRLLARSAAIKLVRPEVLGASGDAEGADHAAAVRARGAGDRGAELAAHDSRLRLRRDRTRAPSTT